MNYFAITFAVNAQSLSRFGLGLAFVQHQIDRALAQSHLSVSPNATKVVPLFNPHSPDDANLLRDAYLPRHTRLPASSRTQSTVSFCETPNPTPAPTRDYPMSPSDNPWRPQPEFFSGTHALGFAQSTRVGPHSRPAARLINGSARQAGNARRLCCPSARMWKLWRAGAMTGSIAWDHSWAYIWDKEAKHDRFFGSLAMRAFRRGHLLYHPAQWYEAGYLRNRALDLVELRARNVGHNYRG